MSLAGSGPMIRPPDTEHVHIIVLYSLARRIGFVADRGTDADVLVRRDAGAYATATDDDAAFDVVPKHRFTDQRGEIRVVGRFVRLARAQVDHVVSAATQVCCECLFEVVASVVGSDSDSHRWGSRM